MNTTPSVENLKAFPLRSGTKQGDGENHYTYKTISWKIVIIIKTNKKDITLTILIQHSTGSFKGKKGKKCIKLEKPVSKL